MRLLWLRPLSLSMVGLALGVGGCASAEPAQLDQAVGRAPQPIMGGYLDPNDFAVVGVLYYKSAYEVGQCTGSLLMDNLVLTAGHCVQPVLNEVSGGVACGQTTFGATYPPGEMYVTTADKFVYDLNPYHAVQEIIVPPNGPGFCGRDQALMILAEPVDITEAVPFVPRVDAPLVPGEIYSAAGFGQTYDSPSAPSGTRYRRDNLRLDCVGLDCNYATYIYPEEWLGETGICSGDSGGPAIDAQNRVIGVTSRGASGCELPIYGNVQSWGEWIKQAAVHAASLHGEAPPGWATGWPTDPAYSWPVGGACTNGCPSGICTSDQCTRYCLPEAPCPGGWECTQDPPICTPIPHSDDDDDEESTEYYSCSLAQPGASDPTQPVPWFAVAAIAGAAVVRRRRR